LISFLLINFKIGKPGKKRGRPSKDGKPTIPKSTVPKATPAKKPRIAIEGGIPSVRNIHKPLSMPPLSSPFDQEKLWLELRTFQDGQYVRGLDRRLFFNAIQRLDPITLTPLDTLAG